MIRPRLGFRDAVEDLVSDGQGKLSDLSGCNRRVEGRLQPRNVCDVIRIVKAARKHGVKLQAFSCGKNWGFGSSLPTNDGCWLVDLSKMDRIGEIDSTGVASLEPGVTQADLYRALMENGNKWFFNITGAGQSTSVLGNALERGIGYYGQRQYDLLELQVVTGTGDVLWTRLARDEAGTSGASIGADLTQLFCQSNWGIVVAARIRLLSRTNGGGVVIARLKEGKSAVELFQRVLNLKLEGCIGGVPHIGNRERIISTMAPWLPSELATRFADRAPAWTAALPLMGCRPLVEAAVGVIQEKLGDSCDLEVIVGAENLDVEKSNPSPVEQLQHLACGFPSNLALPGVQWSAFGQADLSVVDPEKTAAGLIHITPALRSCPTEIEKTVELVRQSGDSLGLPSLAITVNIVDSLTTVLVLSIPFHRKDSAIVQGHARALLNVLRKAGIGFYRMGLIQGSNLRVASKAARQIQRRLRKAFDPHGIFAPSRYDGLFADASCHESEPPRRTRASSTLSTV